MLKLANAAKLAVVGAVVFGVVSITNTSHAAADSFPKGFGNNGHNQSYDSPQFGWKNNNNKNDDNTNGTNDPDHGNKGGDDQDNNIPAPSNNPKGDDKYIGQDDQDKAPCPPQTDGQAPKGDDTKHDDDHKAPCPPHNSGKDDDSDHSEHHEHKAPCPTPEPPTKPCPPKHHEHQDCPKHHEPEHEHKPCPTPVPPAPKPCPKPEHHKHHHKHCPPTTQPTGGMGGGPLPTTPEAPVVTAAAVTSAPAELSNTGFNVQLTSVIATVLLAAAGYVFTRRNEVRE